MGNISYSILHMLSWGLFRGGSVMKSIIWESPKVLEDEGQTSIESMLVLMKLA